MGLKKELLSLGIPERGNFTLTTGIVSNLYFNMKKAYGSPNILNKLSEELYRLLGKDITCIGCLSGIGGLPLASVISAKYNLPLTLVRESKKGHGSKNQIEGYIPNKSDRIAIIDDVFTTGFSLMKVINILEPITNIEGCYVIIKRTDNIFNYRLRHLFIEKDF